MSSDSSAVVSSKEPERLHLAHIEGLRALAALVVYFNHAYAQAWNPIKNQYPSGALSFLSYGLVVGHFAVSIFIAISGFCLTLPVVDSGDTIRGGAKNFFRRRARRILPPYYGALLLSLLLIATVIGKPTGSLWDVPIEINKSALVSHFLMFQDIIGTGRINYVFWSIAVEWHIYFLFPLFVLGVRRIGLRPTLLLSLGVGYALSLGSSDTRLARANPHYVGIFVMGMAAAYFVRSPRPEFARLRSSKLWVTIASLSALAVIVLTAILGIAATKSKAPAVDFLVGLVAFGVLVHSSLNKDSALARFLKLRPLVFVGTFSYSLYLLHAPLLQIIWQYVCVPAGLSPVQVFTLLMTMGLGVILAATYGFFKFCEEPFMTKAVSRPLEKSSGYLESETSAKTQA